MTSAAEPQSTDHLPHSFRAAIWRGIRGKCPRCDGARLFRSWLKPNHRCPTCGVDWSFQRADDFPAYIAIFVSGHVLVPVLMMLAVDTTLSPIQVMAILIPLALAMILGLIQPAKGGVIAAQWWNGMHGFRRERASDADSAGIT